MKGDFRQFIVTKVVSHMTVFIILMLLGIESPATFATEETGEIEAIPIPGLLYIKFRKRVDGTKVDDARIDDFLAKYGFVYLPKQCKDYQYKDCILLPSKYKSASKRSRWRKIDVTPGRESAWIQSLKGSRLVKKVRQETLEISRSIDKRETLDLGERAKKQAPSFLTTFWKENVFEEVKGFLKQRYGCVMESDFLDKAMCGIAKKGNCCIKEITFSNSQKLSIFYLNREVIKHKDWFESLEIEILVAKEISQFRTTISGKYALKRWEGKPVPAKKGEQKDMEDDYYQDLDKFATHFAEDLKRHLEKGSAK
jgi:hypothetical protein